MKKAFECVEMKRETQEEIYEESRDLPPEEELECLHKAAAEFWKEIQSLRNDRQASSAPSLE